MEQNFVNFFAVFPFKSRVTWYWLLTWPNSMLLAVGEVVSPVALVLVHLKFDKREERFIYAHALWLIWSVKTLVSKTFRNRNDGQCQYSAESCAWRRYFKRGRGRYGNGTRVTAINSIQNYYFIFPHNVIPNRLAGSAVQSNDCDVWQWATSGMAEGAAHTMPHTKEKRKNPHRQRMWRIERIKWQN